MQVTKIIRDGRVEAKQLTERSESQEALHTSQQPQIYNLQHFNARPCENDVSLLKPVLKRCRYHKGTPVIITFKSFEVWLIQQASPQNKVHTPIYISLAQVGDLLKLSGSDFEQQIVRGLKQSKRGGFTY